MRGHIGTELNNKAETVLQIAKNTEDNTVSEVTAPLIRSIDMEPVAFTVNDEGLPEQKFGHEFGKKAVKRGFSYTELTEEQHRAAHGGHIRQWPDKEIQEPDSGSHGELCGHRRVQTLLLHNHGTQEIPFLQTDDCEG